MSGSTIVVADRTSAILFTTTATGNPRPLAGTGTVCPTPTDGCGDGALAARAELNAPQGISYDPNDNLYIADTGNNRIRRVAAADRTITTVVGTGQPGYGSDNGAAAAAQLAGPTDVVGDRVGNLYTWPTSATPPSVASTQREHHHARRWRWRPHEPHVADTVNSRIRVIGPAS